jgi:two-component system NtrC family response regulator
MGKESGKKLLIVDDDAGLRRQLRWAFDGFEVLSAEDRSTATTVVRQDRPPVVLLDLGLPPDPHGPTEGLATLREILSLSPESKVIIMTGQTEREYAVRAVGQGAYDFYQKPIEMPTLGLIVERAYRIHELELENRHLHAREGMLPLPGLITTNSKMLELCAETRLLAPSEVSVLLLGESGTGKEVLARAIHGLSKRAEGPFVPINCAAIPEHLLESELFGHEKGAFTGAVKKTLGKIEVADGGTLFLDEIGDLPLSLQAKLFRFLQERVIERIGGRQEIAVDVRVVSATNMDVEGLVPEGQFRQELYYRLAEASITIPPLRERPEDAILIANQLLQEVAKQGERDVTGFSPDGIEAILAYEWPGNVRELENRVKRAAVVARSRRVTATDLGLASPGTETATLKSFRAEADRLAITRALAVADGNISKAAQILDVSRPTLYQLIKELEIKV